MGAIALVIGSINYEDIKLLLRHILIVALNEYEGVDENGEIVLCEISNLKSLITGQGNVINAIDMVMDKSEEDNEERTSISV